MEDWDARVARAWDDDALSGDERIALIDRLAGERDAADARALFERAGARDAAGREDEAEPLYRAALAAGLDEVHRPQAVIQLASTLRNLGRADEGVALLRGEVAREPEGPLRPAAEAFLALALVSAGDPTRAVSVALGALAPRLPLYSRSVAAYAAALVDEA